MKQLKFAIMALAAFTVTLLLTLGFDRSHEWIVGVATADAEIVVTKARIGCLDIQSDGNLTVLVGQACNNKPSCSYKAPTENEYKRAGVHARTRSFCSQGMEITYHCGDNRTKTISVSGDAWNHAPAELTCAITTPTSHASLPPPPAQQVQSSKAASVETTNGIRVTKARIGCLDIQTDGNLTALVAQVCNSKTSCSYKAPKEDAYKRAGVHARTKTFCSQAMEITYRCGDSQTGTVTVPGDAWDHPPAELRCDGRAIAASDAICPSGTFKTTEHHCNCPVGTVKNYHDALKWYADCRAPVAAPSPQVCPSGTFKTTEHHCNCPAGTIKNYHDVLKWYADCRAPTQRPICPLEKVFYTPTDHGCLCPAGSARAYTDEWGSLHAKCKIPTSQPVTTAFDPLTNGYSFGNPGECTAPPYASGLGCCTGMSWSALALYWANVLPSRQMSDMQDDPKLATSIDTTQRQAVANMAADWALKWAEGKADFLGVAQAIDRHTPIPIGLFAPKGLEGMSSQHSVVAYGYWIIDGFHKQVLIYDVDVPNQDCVLYNVKIRNGERWFEYCNDGSSSIAPQPTGPCVGNQTQNCIDPDGVSYWVGFWNEQSYFLSWDQAAARKLKAK
jgi:hypothetical protein